MFITPSFKKSLIVEQFQGNYLKDVVRRANVNKLSYEAVSASCLQVYWINLFKQTNDHTFGHGWSYFKKIKVHSFLDCAWYVFFFLLLCDDFTRLPPFWFYSWTCADVWPLCGRTRVIRSPLVTVMIRVAGLSLARNNFWKILTKQRKLWMANIGHHTVYK